MRFPILYSAIVALFLLVSYASLSAALAAYDSWTNYKPVSFKVEHVNISKEPLAKHVVFVLLDGLSVDVLLGLMKKDEVVGRIANLGALYINGLSNVPSYSIPGRASILTGAPPEVNGAASNEFKGALKVDSIVRVAKDLGYRVLCVGDGSFELLFKDLVDECISVGEGGGHGALSLSYGYDTFSEYARRGERVFIWIGVADIDMVGHEAGSHSVEYNATAVNNIRLFVRFIDSLNKSGLGRDTLVVALNDHGFKKGGHHGGPELEVRRVFLLLIGPVVKPGVYYVQYTHNDIAPTVSMIMGWSLPACSMGKPIGDGLSLPPGRLEAYSKIAQDQRARVVKALSEATGVTGIDYSSADAYDKLLEFLRGESRGYRLLMGIAATATIVSLILALLASGLGGGGLRNIRARSLAGVVAGLASYELLFWAFYFANKGPLSLSDIYSFDELISKILFSCIATAIITGLALGVVGLISLRKLSRSLVYTSTIMILAIALSLAYPIAFYVDYGLTVRFPFPDWNSGVLFFLDLVKTSFTGLIGLPLTATMVSLLFIGSSILRRGRR